MAQACCTFLVPSSVCLSEKTVLDQFSFLIVLFRLVYSWVSACSGRVTIFGAAKYRCKYIIGYNITWDLLQSRMLYNLLLLGLWMGAVMGQDSLQAVDDAELAKLAQEEKFVVALLCTEENAERLKAHINLRSN